MTKQFLGPREEPTSISLPNHMVLNQLLMTYCYTHKLVPLSSLIRETYFCYKWWLRQRYTIVQGTKKKIKLYFGYYKLRTLTDINESILSELIDYIKLIKEVLHISLFLINIVLSVLNKIYNYLCFCFYTASYYLPSYFEKEIANINRIEKRSTIV